MVSPRSFVPARGDLVWLDMSPQSGREQAGRRPAVVISPQAYNRKCGLALFCPITSRVKGYPFEVAVPEGNDIAGVILSDQVRSLDWRSRNAEFAGRLDYQAMEEVLARIAPLVIAESS